MKTIHIDSDSSTIRVQDRKNVVKIIQIGRTGTPGSPATNIVTSVNGRIGAVTGLAEQSSLGTAAFEDITDFATSEQGYLADSAIQQEDLAPITLSGGSVGIGVTPAATALDLKASTTTNSQIRFRTGVAPTSPNDGDMWFDGTALKLRIGGVTKTVTVS